MTDSASLRGTLSHLVPGPDPLDTMLRQADGLQRSGRLGEAEALCRQVLEQRPGHPSALHLLAHCALTAGRLSAAVELAEQALAAIGDSDSKVAKTASGIHATRGLALAGQGRAEEAEASLGRATELDPKSVHAHFNLGILLGQAKRPDDALAAFDTVVELMPENPFAHANRAVALVAIDRRDEALETLRTARALAPDLALATTNLATLLLNMGDEEEALVVAEDGAERNPEDAQSQLVLGRMLGIHGRLLDSRDAVQRALELDPNMSEARAAMDSLNENLS